jgi:chitinase
MWDYKVLPQPGAQEYNDARIGASYSYDPYVDSSCSRITTELMCRSKRLLITYDTPQIAQQKAEYIRNNGLGGAMWWELDADKARGNGSLVEVVRATMGELEYRENELHYPGSSTSRSMSPPKSLRSWMAVN